MERKISIFCLLLALWSCRSGQNAVQKIGGETMGTYYQVSYVGDAIPDLQESIDLLLREINREVSTYEPQSVITRFNQSEKGIRLGDAPHFKTNLACSEKVFEQSEGAFDATVMPLVNYWGFGYTEDKQEGKVDTGEVESILQLVGMEQVRLAGDSLLKDQAGVQLDFSSCAKGYGVDRVAMLLESKGIQHYLVDIGGESRAKGKKPNGDIWRVGINVPDEEASFYEIMTAFYLEDRSVATSGNYRNWYEVNGVKYSHTINPMTGFPERTSLLSASVFHRDCMMADAYATACMVLGVEKALSLAESIPEMDLYVIYSLPDGRMETKYSSGLETLFNQ